MWYFASGDAGFYFAEQLAGLSWMPRVWHSEYGFGTSSLIRLWFDYPYELVVKALSSVGCSWWTIDKLLWASVFILSFCSSYTLGWHVLKRKAAAVVASVIYTTNTYILLLFAGGQIGVALAYSVTPLVLRRFIHLVDGHGDADTGSWNQASGIRYALQNGLLLSLFIAFDLRFAYLILGALLLYSMVSVAYHGFLRRNLGQAGIGHENMRNTLYIMLSTFGIPLFVALSIHMFWILPAILTRAGASSLGEEFTNPGMLTFLSVADFSHSLSLLHPNWPENLFGKVYFLQPEFLMLPILAYSSLLAVSYRKRQIANIQNIFQVEKKHVLYFALLSLVGAFLAKGVQEPFGGIFQFMFEHIPGFILFRDPTKFYAFTAIGYSVLIPFTLHQAGQRICVAYRASRVRHKNIRNAVYALLYAGFFVFWLFTLRALFTGQVAGNVRPLRLTDEYVRLKDMLVSDLKPSRTLWIPREDAFAFWSGTHPLLTSNQLFDNASISAIIEKTQKPDFMKTLDDSGIGYVIVPTDVEKRMFLTDYRFNPKERDSLILALRKTKLIEDHRYGDVAVFKNTQWTMKEETPAIAVRQDKWATIGVYISAASLLAVIGTLMGLKCRRT